MVTQEKCSMKEIYLSDIKVTDLLNLSKKRIFEKMGEYEIFYGLADDEDREGYYYPDYSITIFFDKENLPYVIECGEHVGVIESDQGEKADLIELKVGMSASKIKSILGEGEIIELRDGNLPFALVYRYESFSLWLFLTEVNGDVVGIDIYCFR